MTRQMDSGTLMMEWISKRHNKEMVRFKTFEVIIQFYAVDNGKTLKEYVLFRMKTTCSEIKSFLIVSFKKFFNYVDFIF